MTYQTQCAGADFAEGVLWRVIELFGLEGTLKGNLVQLPCSEQGHLQLEQVLRAPSSLMTLNVYRDRALWATGASAPLPLL